MKIFFSTILFPMIVILQADITTFDLLGIGAQPHIKLMRSAIILSLSPQDIRSLKKGYLSEQEYFMVGTDIVSLQKEIATVIEKANSCTLKKAATLAQLIEAVLNNNIKQVKKFLETGVDVNAKDEEGLTPLHVAAKRGYSEITSLLLAHHADVNTRASEKWKTVVVFADRTSLMFAARNNYPDIIRLLIAAGADKNAQDASGYTALMIAIDVDSREAVDELLKAGADVTIKTSWILGNSACSLASEKPRILEIFKKHGISC